MPVASQTLSTVLKYPEDEEAVRQAGIERDVLEGRSEAELVCAAYERGGFDDLDVVLDARGIEQRRLAEADHAGDLEEGAA